MKHAIVNTIPIKANNATAIPPDGKAPNLNGNSGNVYPDDEKLRKQSELGTVKAKTVDRIDRKPNQMPEKIMNFRD